MYTLTLTGTNVENADWNESIAQFSKLFEITEGETENLLAHAPVSIKSDLSIEQAESLKLVIAEIGLESEVQESELMSAVVDDKSESPAEHVSFFSKIKNLFKRN